MREVRPNTRLRELRLRRGLALYGLGALADVSPSAICAAERWGYRPGPESRRRIAYALGVSEQDLWAEQELVEQTN